LTVPLHPVGIVIFALGGGSDRFSPRNQFVARILEEAGLATLLLDLLAYEEVDDRCKLLDIDLLAERLEGAADWLSEEPRTRALPVGYFGSNTGVAAAFVVAAQRSSKPAAIVSCSGRPDLALDVLADVRTPTLLVVGINDGIVIDLNERAYRALHCPKEMIVIPDAANPFKEPGALEKVAMLARSWFLHNFRRAGTFVS